MAGEEHHRESSSAKKQFSRRQALLKSDRLSDQLPSGIGSGNPTCDDNIAVNEDVSTSPMPRVTRGPSETCADGCGNELSIGAYFVVCSIF